MPLTGPYKTREEAEIVCGSSSSSSSSSSVQSETSLNSDCIDPGTTIACCPYPTPAWPSSVTVTIHGTKTCPTSLYGPGTYTLTYDSGYGYWVEDPSFVTGPGLGLYCAATFPLGTGIIAFVMTYVTIEGVCGCSNTWIAVLGSCDPLDVEFHCPFDSACNDFPPFCLTTGCTDLDWVIEVTA